MILWGGMACPTSLQPDSLSDLPQSLYDTRCCTQSPFPFVGWASSYQSAQEMRQERGIPVVTCSGSWQTCKAALSPWLPGAAGHTGWYVPHLVLWAPPALGLTDSQCQAREVLQPKISRTQWGADRQAEGETDVEPMWCEDCV